MYPKLENSDDSKTTVGAKHLRKLINMHNDDLLRHRSEGKTCKFKKLDRILFVFPGKEKHSGGLHNSERNSFLFHSKKGYTMND